MGMDRYDYIMIGIQIDPDQLEKAGKSVWDEEMDPYLHGDPKVKYRIVFDQGSRDTIVFGLVLAKAHHDEDFGVSELRNDPNDYSYVLKAAEKLFGREFISYPKLLAVSVFC